MTGCGGREGQWPHGLFSTPASILGPSVRLEFGIDKDKARWDRVKEMRI